MTKLIFYIAYYRLLLSQMSEQFWDENSNKYEQTPWPLVRKQTILTDRPPLVGEI
jgi:hypothetical protein